MYCKNAEKPVISFSEYGTGIFERVKRQIDENPEKEETQKIGYPDPAFVSGKLRGRGLRGQIQGRCGIGKDHGDSIRSVARLRI